MYYFRKSMFRIFGLLVIVLGANSTQAENLYNPVSGELIMPVIDGGDGNLYFGRFSRVSENPLRWAALSLEPVGENSRTVVSYDSSTSMLRVPEINVNGELFDVSFRITDSCSPTACLEPIEDSVVANGRDGSIVFTTPISSNSTFSCSSCHAMSEENGVAADALRRPGHPMQNATQRPSFKNGQLGSLLDAVNICVTEWMNGDELQADDQDWINLRNWIADQSTVEVADPISIDIVEPPSSLTGGDAANGRALFNESCIVCHGFDGNGTQLAPQISGRGLQAELIANRVRTSGRLDSAAYTGLSGGVMPFWASDRLSDGELIDIIAFVSTSSGESIDMGMDTTTTTTDTQCSQEHSRVGQSAVIAGFFHDVAGTATIIDDCTVQITGFAFDGGGIDTRIYLGAGGEFRDSRGGFAISPNLVGEAFFNNTLTYTLPQGKTLDDFDSISVWCIPVGVSFGTGFFN